MEIKGKAFYNTPLFLEKPYGWVEHIPFAFYLIESLRPEIFVELGTHSGNSYFSFCQAVDELKINAKCYAIDTWEGDSQAGFYGKEVYDRVKKINSRYFSSISNLLKMKFDEAIPYFSDRSIDLLHIDGLHTYDAVKHDFETWLPKMSENGVIVLHDVNVREREFGVWKFYEEVRTHYPSFEFIHSHGLGVLCVGKEVDANFLKFVECAEKDKAIQQFFSALGNRVLAIQETDDIKNEILLLKRGGKKLEDEIEKKEVQIQKLTDSIEKRNDDIAILKEKIQENLSNYNANNIKLKKRIDELSLMCEAHKRDLLKKNETISTQESRLLEHKELIVNKNVWISSIEKKLKEHQDVLLKKNERLASLESKLKEHQDVLLKKNERLASLESKLKEHQDVLLKKNERLASLESKLKEHQDVLLKKNERISSLEMRVKEHQEVITKKNERLSVQEIKLIEQRDIIIGKNDRINKLEAKLSENKELFFKKDEKIANIERSIADQKDVIAKRNERIVLLAERINELKDSISKKNERITSQELKIQELIKTLYIKNDIIENFKESQFKLRDSISQRDERIQELVEKQVLYNRDLKEQKGIIERLNSKLLLTNNTLNERNKETVLFKELTKKKDEILTKKNDELKGKEKRIHDLSIDNRQHKETIESLNRIIQLKNKEINSLHKSLSWRITKPLRFTKKIVKLLFSNSFVPVKIFWFIITNQKEKLRREYHAIKYKKIIAKSDFFDKKWYLQQYPDVSKAGKDPVKHYLIRGAVEGRNPSPLFNTQAYLNQNRDISIKRINPLVHYVLYGKVEGRKVLPIQNEDIVKNNNKTKKASFETIKYEGVAAKEKKGVSLILFNINDAFNFSEWNELFQSVGTIMELEVIVKDNTLFNDNPTIKIPGVNNLKIVKGLENKSEVHYKNVAATHAKYDYLFFVDAGIKICDYLIFKKILEFFENISIGVIGGVITDQKEAKTVLHNGVSFSYDEQGILKQISCLTKRSDYNQDGNSKVVPAVTGGFLCCKKSDFILLDGFCEELDSGLEDVDYCLRINKIFGKDIRLILLSNILTSVKASFVYLNEVDNDSLALLLNRNSERIQTIFDTLAIEGKGCNDKMNTVLYNEYIRLKHVAQAVYFNLVSRHKENRILKERLKKNSVPALIRFLNNRVHKRANTINIEQTKVAESLPMEKQLHVYTKSNYQAREFFIKGHPESTYTFTANNKFKGIKRFHKISAEITQLPTKILRSGLRVTPLDNSSFIEIPGIQYPPSRIVRYEISLFNYKNHEISLYYQTKNDIVFNEQKSQKRKTDAITQKVVFELGSTHLVGNQRLVFQLTKEPFWIESIDIKVYEKQKQSIPLFSFVIPCYNHGDFVEETIESIMQVKQKELYEIIVVDDGSTDEACKLVLEKIERKGALLIKQKNLGLGAARNNGIRRSKGKYILPVDADNKIRPTYFYSAIEMFETDPEIGVVYGDVWFFGEQEYRRTMELHSKSHQFIQNKIDACAAFRREVWEQIGGYQEQMIGYQDWEFWAAVDSLNYWKFYHIKDIAFDYRKLAGSMVSHTKLFTDELLDYISSRHVRSLRKLHKEYYNQLQSQQYKSSQNNEVSILINRDAEPLVSVIAPNYNKAPFLRLRLDSILKQTYRNFELIILDDASTDNSIQIINEIATGNNRIKVIQNNENSGNVFKQWRKGIDNARGEIIWIAECDDFADVTFLERLVPNLMQKTNIHLAYCQSNFVNTEGVVFDNHLRILNRLDGKLWHNNFIMSGKDFINEFMRKMNCLPNASAVVFRRELVKLLNWEEVISYKVCGDWSVWIQFLKHSNLYFNAESLNYFRFDEKSVRMKEGKDLTRLIEHYEILRMIYNEVGLREKDMDNSLDEFFKKLKNHVKNNQVKEEQLLKLLTRISKDRGSLSFSIPTIS
jgi:glycosyltransferase involved in cell wall biosynthesis